MIMPGTLFSCVCVAILDALYGHEAIGSRPLDPLRNAYKHAVLTTLGAQYLSKIYLFEPAERSEKNSYFILTELQSWLKAEMDHNLKSSDSDGVDHRIAAIRKLIQQEINSQQGFTSKNFAAASAGATVVDASKTWDDSYPQKYFLLLPISSTVPSPNVALQPSSEVGDCWPMEGSKGHLLIHLAARIIVEGFSLSHVDSTLHLAGIAAEAPKNFSVYGVRDQTRLEDRHLFGVYSYSNRGPATQTFKVLQPSTNSFVYVDLIVGSNHGHRKYTCLYRFQVHGKMDESQCLTC